MTLSVFQDTPTLGVDPHFRNFVASYRAALIAAGFVRTSDSGQIDPTTVVRPSTSQVAGYEIWRFNDAAQATKPIFFKFEYGTGTTIARWVFFITIGTGSDGAGNITGIRIPRIALSQTANSAVLSDVWVAGGEGYLASGLWASVSAGSVSLGWIIERLRLSTGLSDTSNDGAGIVFGNYNAWFCSTYDGTWTESNTEWPSLNSGGLFTYRGITYAYPYYPVVGNVRGASRAAICVNSADAGYTVPFTVPLYGVSHVFRGIVSSSSNHGRGSSAAFALRFE